MPPPPPEDEELYADMYPAQEDDNIYTDNVVDNNDMGGLHVNFSLHIHVPLDTLALLDMLILPKKSTSSSLFLNVKNFHKNVPDTSSITSVSLKCMSS